jgi:hypothetical protein
LRVSDEKGRGHLERRIEEREREREKVPSLVKLFGDDALGNVCE